MDNMEVKSFKQARSSEMEFRTLYQQQLIKKQKEFISTPTSATVQSFHPLQQQSFFVQEEESEEEMDNSMNGFEMDMIDDFEVPTPIKKREQVIKKIPNQVNTEQPTFPSRMSQSLSYSSTNYEPNQEPIDTKNPEQEMIYKSFVFYFNNPKMIKVNESNDSYSLYYARVNFMLAEYRYLIVVVEQDLSPKGSIIHLNHLNWKSFQLRTLYKEVPAPEVNYNKENNGVFDDELVMVKRDKEDQKVIYKCKFNPLMVELIPKRKGNIMDYPDKTSLENAMDTFHCVIYFV